MEKKGLSLGGVLTSYRNLRENYEYRLRYDEAGQFFVREMEIKRKFREKFSTTESKYIPKQNNWLRRNFLSFIALYHLICNYGESTTRPLILFGLIIFLSARILVSICHNQTGTYDRARNIHLERTSDKLLLGENI